ncbi:Annexin [Zostera marina]|uniref:Annexin n=1 Tax=Zostera marina TaxID=29655 RepID=A0A0K9PN28_ZOSMR|nr:Annexin [Zostera marina]
MSSLVVPPSLESPRKDATDLYKAFKGFGCDTKAVVNILSHRDATQRALIQQEYKSMYGDELTKRLRSELSGDLERAVLLWLHDPATRDATIVMKALHNDSVDLQAAIEVICSRTPSQIQVFKQTYYMKFGYQLEYDVQQLASGDLEKLLLTHITTMRYEGPEVDPNMVERDGRDLYKAGEKRFGTDEMAFIHIFCTRSSAHLAAVASYYHNTYGNSLEKALKSETSGNFEFALLTILRTAINPAAFFAKRLRKSMKGIGTTDSMLIRIVVSRTEIDMQYIKMEYQKKYKKPLSEAIHSETSGQYRAFLLALVGTN